MTKKEKIERVESAREWLRKLVLPGTRVYCILKRVNQGGDYRHIQLAVVAADHNGKQVVRNISAPAATLMDRKLGDSTGGVCIRGGGMDMGFALVCELSYRLYGDEYSLKHEWL